MPGTNIIVAIAKLGAWLSLLFVIGATLGPINSRPASGLPVPLERFAAFAVVGLLFVVAYPKRVGVVAVFLVVVAISLEALQLFSPDRHARVLDVAEKVAGVIAGIVVGSSFTLLKW